MPGGGNPLPVTAAAWQNPALTPRAQAPVTRKAPETSSGFLRDDQSAEDLRMYFGTAAPDRPRSMRVSPAGGRVAVRPRDPRADLCRSCLLRHELIDEIVVREDQTPRICTEWRPVNQRPLSLDFRYVPSQPTGLTTTSTRQE
jgi:hypothetical protein